MYNVYLRTWTSKAIIVAKLHSTAPPSPIYTPKWSRQNLTDDFTITHHIFPDMSGKMPYDLYSTMTTIVLVISSLDLPHIIRMQTQTLNNKWTSRNRNMFADLWFGQVLIIYWSASRRMNWVVIPVPCWSETNLSCALFFFLLKIMYVHTYSPTYSPKLFA